MEKIKINRSEKRIMARWVFGGKIKEMYLDYFNNFLTVDGFADHYRITPSSASRIIALCQKYREVKIKDLQEELTK